MPTWLAHLVAPAVAEALGSTHPDPSHGRREPSNRLRDAISCDVGSAQVAIEEIMVPMQWHFDLASEAFPPVVDVELRSAEASHEWSRLSLRATYECPSAPGQDDMQRAVGIAANAYLVAVATWL